MKTIALNRNMVFSALLVVIIATIIHRITPPYVTPVFNLVISKNRVAITNIHQPRDIEMTKTVKVDRLNLADKNRFRHAKLGDLGYSNDFFVDINSSFMVKKAGSYVFNVASDDGFIFSVDGKQLCEWNHDRPLTTDSCHVKLTEGSHSFSLVYFQGYGNAGLIMHYGFSSDGKLYLAGEDSKYLQFLY